MKILLISTAAVGLVGAFNSAETQRGVKVQDILQTPSSIPEIEEPRISKFPENTFEENEPGFLASPPVTKQQQQQVASPSLHTRTVRLSFVSPTDEPSIIEEFSHRNIRPSHQRPRRRPTSTATSLSDKPPETLVQGTSVQTWTFLPTHHVKRLQVDMSTAGRPLDALVELWQGPENIPQKMRVYSENGKDCPFSTLIETPVAYNTLAVKNTGNLEFPLGATVVDADTVRPNYSNPLHSSRVTNAHPFKQIQGNSLHTYKYNHEVVSLQIVLQTDGLPLAARVELSQGPNNVKQIIDVYSQDGMTYPVSLVIETPGNGKVVRIMNTASMEYPLKAWIEPCTNLKNKKIEVMREEETKRIRPSADSLTSKNKDEDALDIEFQRSHRPSAPQRHVFDRTSEHHPRESQTALPYFWAKSEDMSLDDKLGVPSSPGGNSRKLHP
eukprot:scaffold1_cov108-Cylindrotheca_fusiformis.AAC.2